MSAHTDSVEIAQALIRCRSVTPAEGGAQAYLSDLLKRAGFDVQRQKFSSPGMPEVDNLFAKIGAGKPHLVFGGHTDVVPPGNESSWSHPPFAGEIADGNLFGRGATDMKGAIAAFAAAVLDFTAQGKPIKIGRRGSLSATLSVFGKQGHVAYPDRAQNPMRPLVTMLEALTEKPFDSGTKEFQRSNLEVTSVESGNPAFNVIPAEAKARFNVRFNDKHNSASLKKTIEKRLKAAAKGARYRLDYEPPSESYLTRRGPFVDLVVKAVAASSVKAALSTSGGTSDARFIKNYCPVVDLGLVGNTMHQIDEHVPLEDLQRLTKIYRRILEKYFEAFAA